MCTHLKVAGESVSHNLKSDRKRMVDSLWCHPKHQGRGEHRHDTKKERDLLPSPNDFGGMPCG